MMAIVFGLAVLLVPGLALADVVELANGERVEGAGVRASPDHVTIQVGGRTVIFGREQVRAVYFGPAPQPCGPGQRP